MAFIIHYTYSQDLDASGDYSGNDHGLYHFDKRQYESGYPPRGLPLPEKCQGSAIPTLMRGINAASAAIEPWSIV